MSRSLFTIFSPDHHEHLVFWVDYDGKELSPSEVDSLKNKIIDSVDQKLLGPGDLKGYTEVVTFKPGVTDNPAKSFKELLERQGQFKGRKIEVHSGILSSRKLESNPFIHERFPFTTGEALTKLDFSLKVGSEISVREYDILTMDDESLTRLSVENCWALSLPEMKVIQAHYQTLGRVPTDVEMEMLAQTWSEHCKHKIFNARIDYQDKDRSVQIESLFKEYIKKPTHDMKKPWAVSLFDDNAGVVRFREGMDLCIKVETHNSPSALDPYGGALTGILGVNRDILGTGLGAKPVANTDVFCVGMPDESELPANLLHPNDILRGIHKGVQDGGNKSGIPTVNGAIYFDESYSGKPLVYCGTVGIIPPTIQGRDACKKGQRPGDLVVMVGGAVGIDGIHGATASSLVMDKNTTLGMVQIGDPFTQKRVLDFILAARDRLLFNSITDNGAGGLSSSVGEMSGATNGAKLFLDSVPLKYPGLTPWQILVSESQERMTLSVPKENWQELKNLADHYQVEATNVGEFTNDGNFTCYYHDKKVCDIKLAFLHDGLPKMNLKARHEGSYKTWKKTKTHKNIDLNAHTEVMKELLSHPTIASKEKWIRQYDHEVQGGTVVKPMEGLSSTAPNDAAVLWYGAYGLGGTDGFAVASGLCPHFSQDDTFLMTKLAVDEAVRNLMCHGVDPEKVALVDNFCWPDPTPSAKNPDAEFKLAQLVRSCMGLKEIMETYQMPLVSGKDSMKNDYHGEKVKISVLPTLLVTALGHVPDVTRVPKSHLESGKLVYRLGLKDYDQYFGHFLHNVSDIPRANNRDFNWKRIRELYTKMAAKRQIFEGIHDVSEGGFLVSLFESCLLNKVGVTLTQTSVPYLYSELPGHFVVSIDKKNQAEFEKTFAADEWELLGLADDTGLIKVGNTAFSVSELEKSWRSL